MAKWIIRWNVGSGDNHQIVEADTEEQAEQMAHELWREWIQGQEDYGAEAYDQERAIELGLEDDPDDE